MKSILLIVFMFFLGNFYFYSQEDEVWFQPNRGQWDSKILYKVGLLKGDFFIEKDGFTYALSDIGDVYHAAHDDEEFEKVQFHTVKSKFLNSAWQGVVKESDSSLFYQNYFLGNDQSSWKSKVYSYKKLELTDFYPDIDLILEAFPDKIKYSFRVHPFADVSNIQMLYEGMSDLLVSDNEIEIQTRFGSIYEKELKVWEEVGNQKERVVSSKFQRNGDTVSFHFPNGYNQSKTLIIDPSLTFSTFTGATVDNWGFTAAPDDEGNLYGGGIVFGTGYPITTGAYDDTFNGGPNFTYKIDMGISKFSPDGTQLLYSTFIGGGDNETPNSIITNSDGELYILGITGSDDFPTSPNAYQTTNQGGISTTQIAIQFGGTDIVVCKLSSDGSQLLGSTFLGGSKNDGLNISSLNYNYGDVFRGEIILDHNGDVVFTSSTQSSDFPIVNGAITTLGGGQDAVVVKMTPDLSDIIWSTYLGGNGDDSGFSLQVSSNNNLYVTGGTKSTNLPFSNGYKTSFQGGIGDGYVAKLNGQTSQIITGTYIGTPSYDQSFFVQLDSDDNVYVFGQSMGNIPVSSGVYNNPNSGQFLQQYTSDLSALNWSTRVGGGSGFVEISPTAFLVSTCNEIYFSGWGGQVNQSVQATHSSSNGFPVTSDAYQSNTNGNNFYIGVLSENAQSLVYGTFMGGVNSSYNHVDGGTSRFDKHGTIYHAVCGACGGNPNGFTTTPGAWSETNNSSNCNMAVWKFDLYKIKSVISVPDPVICIPDSVYFQNDSENGSSYYWDFGDGGTSTAYEPSHFYSQPGIYDVMLIVGDPSGCYEPDTTYIQIEILDFEGGEVSQPDKICPGESVQLEASGGEFYQWSPAEFLDDPNIANPIATLDSTTTFTVIVSDGCGADTLTVVAEVAESFVEIIDNQEICVGDTIQLWASGGSEYNWSNNDPSSFIGNTNQPTVWVAPSTTTTYSVEVISGDGCSSSATVNVKVYQDVPYSVLDDTLHICQDEQVTVTVQSDATAYQWYPNNDISSVNTATTTFSPPFSQWYFVDLFNPCGVATDSVFIDVVNTYPQAGNDTIVCPGEPVLLWASGGESYVWSPSYSVSHPFESETMAKPLHPTVYTVIIVDEYGCVDSAKVNVDHYPEPYVIAGADYYGFAGDEVDLYIQGSSSNGTYHWEPETYLNCSTCKNPIATPPRSTQYIVTFTDENGCEATDEVNVFFENLIYVPNSFTPDGNEYNNVFKAVGGNILEFEMLIFDRWGELIFESHDISQGWDGTYGGKICKDGTYIWKIKYLDLEYKEGELVGHVNLLR